MDLEEQYDKLLRYCYMKVRDRALAEDLTQESFIRFFESTRYRSTGKEMAYLYTIAGNLCTDHFRKRKEMPFDGLPPEEPSEEGAEQNIIDRLSIEAALDRLPSEEREIVMLRFSAELSLSDIGEMLGLSRFAVRRRISSALKKLREEMGE